MQYKGRVLGKVIHCVFFLPQNRPRARADAFQQSWMEKVEIFHKRTIIFISPSEKHVPLSLTA